MRGPPRHKPCCHRTSRPRRQRPAQRPRRLLHRGSGRPRRATTITKQIITTRRGTTETHHEYRHDDKQVRTSIIRTIAKHLQPNPPGESWSNLNYDFTGAQIHDANFDYANFASTAVFDRAQFHGENTSFRWAQFHGKNTSFNGAQFHSKFTLIDNAQFRSDDTSFSEAQFHGKITSFNGAQFRTAYTWFANAQFHSEKTAFDEAQFHGKNTTFFGAEFRSETTSFIEAQFHGKFTWFGSAQFHGDETGFDKAQFHSDATSFDNAQFDSDETWFLDAQFHGEITFDIPMAWTNVQFDWTWPLLGDQEGPAIAKPQNVKPDKWPPTLAN